MTTQRATQEERYLAAFERFQENGAAGDPAWLHDLRREAIARFADLGFPTARRGNEEWKYTDVGPIAKGAFQPAAPPAPGQVTARHLRRFAPTGSRLVFIDRRYAPKLSSLSPLPSGVTVTNLAQAAPEQVDLARQHLARHADFQGQAFTALNTAFIHDGALVHVPDGVTVDDPLQLLFLSTGGEPDTLSHPRVLVLAGKESRVTVVERYAGLAPGRYFTNAVTEVVAGPGARVELYKVQQEGEEAFHVGTTQATLQRDSAFASFTLDLGGGLVRNNLSVLMEGEGSSCVVNGLTVVGGSQHVDNQTLIDHAVSHTTSREAYKGVLGGRSRSVFHGSIVVRRDAQKVDAQQTDKNLLLSDRAEADTSPAFWIYADDVKCSHGAACGPVDEDALLYLRSRGIGEQEARYLLAYGFVNDVLSTIPTESVRVHLEELAVAKLREL